ncbi:dicarboxylate/amino acid:cation symporter, partial [Fusobacterium nucleatum]|uniref:dicarboxylate/amino acid:cation symporter n=1 Tax=Fusobacterium nucleatum TaxID=851 RepID=UPI0003B85CB9
MKKLALWKQIIIAILLGILVGVFMPNIVPKFKFLGDIFLRLLKMLIAPLVLFTLISGVCKMGDIKQLRTVGMRIVIFYLASSTVSAILGVLIALFTQPGKGVIDLLGTEVGKDVSYNFIENLIGWVPINIFEALATGNTLQIIFFALLMGVVLLSLGDSVSVVIKIVDQAADAMMKLTEIVMKFAPIGIFALIADLTISLSGNMLKQVLNMSLGDSVSVVIKIVDQAADAMMKLTEIVMKFA